MANFSRTISGAFACLLFLAGTIPGHASERRVTMNQMPAPVRETAMKISKGAKIKGLSKETEHGKTTYEVETFQDGRGKDFTIDSNGNVIEIEEQVELSSLPESIRTELRQKAGNGKILKIESVTKNGKLVNYEAQVRNGRHTREIEVAAN